jgi:hypothetical protein
MNQDVANARGRMAERLNVVRVFVMDPWFWFVLGMHLEQLRTLLKPYASADVRVPFALIGTLLTTAGTIRILLGIARDPSRKHLEFTRGFGMGMLVGLMFGAGWVLVAVTSVPPYLRLAGLALSFLASILGLLHSRHAEETAGNPLAQDEAPKAGER